MEKPFCTLPDGSCLIETFGWSPSKGAARLDLHLARLAKSAQTFGISLDQDVIAAKIDAISAVDALRCRLTVGKDGSVDLVTAPMPTAADRWNVAISADRLDSRNPFLNHKTSQRALYDISRKEMAVGIDEVIFLNERSEVCEGTITNVLVKSPDGHWLTPPISCGCLPGAYREYLLTTGQAHEAILTVNDLLESEDLRLCNSLRGEIKSIVKQ